MSEIVITQQELNVRKSHGTVYICRSCKDNLNKIVLLRYEAGKRPTVITGFCTSCLEAIDSCRVCPIQKQNPI
jgi:uncharacterized CHY-type Zn-finger protein